MQPSVTRQARHLATMLTWDGGTGGPLQLSRLQEGRRIKHRQRIRQPQAAQSADECVPAHTTLMY